ncbi:MAG: Brp/Blh family beta-carotene 15,15'-dioxygenase, partial [Polaribacter sp.]|nr:Brp/Blh family beta-carotene 15,15'-dioxygenase [Polaribacter sp.]
KNYQNFKIFFTVFLFWFSIQFGKPIEDSLAFFLVISVGIIHGANDLLILSLKQVNNINFKKNLFIYIGIVLSCVVLFLLQPFLSILLFVFISCYHFGEEHLSDKVSINPFFDTIYFIIYGMLIFSMLFYAALPEVNTIMMELSNVEFSYDQIKYTLIVSLLFFMIMNVFLLWKKKILLPEFLKELFFLALLSLVFKTSSLILSFAIYFIFWHSIPSIIHQIFFISGDFTKKTVLFYVKKALFYWLLSVVGLLILYFFIPQINLFSTVIFVILLSVTAPHIWVMYKMKN